MSASVGSWAESDAEDEDDDGDGGGGTDEHNWHEERNVVVNVAGKADENDEAGDAA